MSQVLKFIENRYFDESRKVGVAEFFHFNDFRYRHVFAFGDFEVAELDGLVELINFFLEKFRRYRGTRLHEFLHYQKVTSMISLAAISLFWASFQTCCSKASIP